MSGFELDKQRQGSQHSLGKDSVGGKKSDSNQALLEQLRRSDNITRDLALLYSERPFVYARVMEQLDTVLGKGRVKKLHNDVVAKAKVIQEEKAAAAKQKATKKFSVGKSSVTVTGDPGETKEILLDVPVLGLNKTLELKSEGGNYTLSCADWNMPFLNATSCSVQMQGDDVSAIRVDAELNAKYLSRSAVTFLLVKQKGKFQPILELDADVEIPGINGLNVKLEAYQAEAPEVVGTLSTSAAIFDGKLDTEVEGQVGLSTLTNISGSFTIKSGKGGQDKGGKGGKGGKGDKGGKEEGGKGGAAESSLKFEGNVCVNSDGEVISVAGNIVVSGLGFLASPESTISLNVNYDEEKGFSAELAEPVTFEKFTISGEEKESKDGGGKGGKGGGKGGGFKALFQRAMQIMGGGGGAKGGKAEQKDGGQQSAPTTVVLSVNSASYSSEEELSVGMTATAELGGFMTSTGEVNIVNNKFESGTLNVKVPEFALPAKQPILSGSLDGTVDFDASGFVQANVTGPFTITIGGKTCPISLQSLSVDRTGLVVGTINLPETWKIGCVSFDTLSAAFNSNGLQSVTGTLSIDHKYIKSGDKGVTITGSGAKLSAEGELIVTDGEENEFGRVNFSTAMAPDLFEGKGTLTLSQDYKVGKSKLVINKDSSATVSFKNDKFDDIQFQGGYKYNVQEGKGDKGGKGTSSNALSLEGQFTNCALNMETGALTGAASARLLNSLKVGKGKNFVELVDKHRSAKTDITLAFANSEVTSITGTVAAKAGLSLGKKNDNLKLEGKLSDFNYDVASSSLSGLLHAGFNEDLDIPAMENFKIRGNDRTNFDLDIVNNNIEAVRFNCDAQLRVHNKSIKGGQADIDMNCEKGSFDVASSAISIEKIEISPENNKKNDLIFMAHKGQTELTVKDGSSISTSILENKVQALVCDLQYKGKTTALKTKQPVQFSGKVGFAIQDISNPASTFSAQMKLKTDNDVTLKQIPKVDKITLRKNTNVEVAMSDAGIETICGDIKLRYTNTDKKNKFLKGGYTVDLEGRDFSYDVQKGKFNGRVVLKPGKDIQVALGKGNNTMIATLLAKGSKLESVIVDNELTSLTGQANFDACFRIGSGAGYVNVQKGVANLDVNVDTGAINKFTLDCAVGLRFNAGKVEISTKRGKIRTSLEMDSNGFKSMGLKGGVYVKTPVGENDVELRVISDLEYDRDNGLNGDAKVVCQKETLLGTIPHKTTSFEYGLAGKGMINAMFVNSSLEGINGSAGFFFRQPEGTEDRLNVNGRVDFDLGTKPMTLNSVHGQVTIDRKKLFSLGSEHLYLEQSTAELNVLSDKIQSLSGVVNLRLSDANGDYLAFMSAGEFDCLDTKAFTGDVSAQVIRDKQLGKPFATNRGEFGLYLAEGKTAFETKIEDNQIKEASGSMGVKTTLNNDPFFTGSVTGSYKAASPDTGEQSQLNGSGTITLERNIYFPSDDDQKFALGKGSSGTANLENNEITSFSGELVILIAPPGKKISDGSYIEVKAAGEVDVKKAHIKSFTGQASLVGDVEIAKGLKLTTLNAQVSIVDNELKEISGAASIEYKKGGFTITGACETFQWIKGGKDPDKFKFVGSLTVTAFEDKLKGTARVSYDTMNDPKAAPKVEGELEFKITSWLGGKVGIKFGDSGWDDPIISGAIIVTDAELIAGRRLMSFQKDLGVNIPIYAGINLEAGVGFGASIEMLPVLINGKIEINDYHIKDPKGLPDFTMAVDATTGLSFKASISPYVGVNIGIANIMSAGLRVRGKAELATTAKAKVGGELKGGAEGFSGKLSLGFGCSAKASVSVIPEVYANLLGNEFKHEITKWTFDLGEIFKFDWNKTFSFGDKGNKTEDGGAAVEQMSPSAEQVETETKKGEAQADYAPEGSKDGGDKDKPALPGSDEVGKDSMGKNVGDSTDKVGGIGETIEQATQVAEAVGAIAQAVGMVTELVAGFASGSFIGLAIVLLKLIFIDKKLTISNLSKMFTDIVEGVQALKKLLKNAGDLLKKILPKWVIKIIDFFKGETFESLSKKVIKILEDKIAGLANPLPRILAPVLDFIKGQTQKIVEIIDLVSSGNVGKIIKGVLKILGFALTSIWDLINMGGQMLKIMRTILKECIASGSIWLKEKKRKWKPNKYTYAVKIYDLVNFKGDNWAIGKALLIFLPKYGLKVQRS